MNKSSDLVHPLTPEEQQELLGRSLCDILPPRTVTLLEKKGITTVHDLLMLTPETLLSIRNIGEKILEDIYKALEGLGFYRNGRGPRAAEAATPAVLPTTGLQRKTDVQSSA